MIVVDTNVISELMRPNAEESVRSWTTANTPELHTTAVTQAEILFGLTLLPVGRRSLGLLAAADTLFGDLFSGRILPFDVDAAKEYARIAANKRQAGLGFQSFDMQIAAIARAHGAALATRNIRDFTDCGVKLIDPWAH
jgi:predicted nucleic acid-binding protein